MVCAICMWGVGIGLLRVVPSFASWSATSLPEIPVCVLNKHYKEIAFKHFYHTQHKDNRNIKSPQELPQVNIYIQECKLDKNIIIDTPKIQITNTKAQLYDKKGTHIHTIPTTILKRLWQQYNSF